MGLSEPLLVLVGIAGVMFMTYAFSQFIKLKGRVRMFAISAIMLVTVLLGNRIFDSRLSNSNPSTNPSTNPSINSLWDLLPKGPVTEPGIAQTGWQDLPLDVLGIFLAALSSQSPTPYISPVPASPPSVSPTPTPTPSPIPTVSASPSPTIPPSVSQPSVQPYLQPSISPAPVQPSVQPYIQPYIQPTPVQPSLPPSSAQPYNPYAPYAQPSPNPAPQPPRPAPNQPAQPPVSAWW